MIGRGHSIWDTGYFSLLEVDSGTHVFILQIHQPVHIRSGLYACILYILIKVKFFVCVCFCFKTKDSLAALL